MMNSTLKLLSTQFLLTDYSSRRSNVHFVTAEKVQLSAILSQLRDRYGYPILTMVTAVDWIEQDKFQIIYLLYNPETHTNLGIKILIDRNDPVVDSIHNLWPHARVYQQELHEMFGIVFPGSPGLYEPMILEGWQGLPPMRRDFDTLKYSQSEFEHRPRSTNAPEEHMKQQLYPED